MDYVLPVIALLAVLFLMGRGLPGRRWPMILAATLLFVTLVVVAERNGLWPSSWRVR